MENKMKNEFYFLDIYPISYNKKYFFIFLFIFPKFVI